MLSEHEQKIWDEIERNYPARQLPAVVIGGGWSSVLLVLFGVPSAGVAVAAATGLIWLLWRFFPQVPGVGRADTEPMTEHVDVEPAPPISSRRCTGTGGEP